MKYSVDPQIIGPLVGMIFRQEIQRDFITDTDEFDKKVIERVKKYLELYQ